MRSNNSSRAIGIIVLILGIFTQGFLLKKKNGNKCSNSEQCKSGRCAKKSKTCQPKKGTGAKCKNNNTCKSGRCSKRKKKCKPAKSLLQRILLASSQSLNKAQDLPAFGVKAQSASRNSPALEGKPRVVQNLRI